MSMQSDIELLSVQALERYAEWNDLTPGEASDLFHQHQIFEKIILQHEYLHQVSFHTEAALGHLKLVGRG